LVNQQAIRETREINRTAREYAEPCPEKDRLHKRFEAAESAWSVVSVAPPRRGGSLRASRVNRLRHPLPARTLSPHAAAHGILRRRQGYTASMLIEESRMLGVAIFHTLHTNAHRIDFNVLLMDVMVIADEVNSQLAAIPLYKTFAV
jgi:hypothetical protein